MLLGRLNQSESGVAHVVHIVEMIMPFRILVIKYEEKNLLERHRCMWEDDYSTMDINPMKVKCNLLYIRTQCVPPINTLHLGYKKTNQLVMCKVKVAVCSEIYIQHIIQCQHHVEFLNVKLGGM